MPEFINTQIAEAEVLEESEKNVEMTFDYSGTVVRDGEEVEQTGYGIEIGVKGIGELANIDRSLKGTEAEGYIKEFMDETLQAVENGFGSQIAGVSSPDKNVLSKVTVYVEGKESGRAQVSYGTSSNSMEDRTVKDMAEAAVVGEEEIDKLVSESLSYDVQV